MKTPVGEWTRPYYGITHLITYHGTWRADRFQFTASEHGTFTQASVLRGLSRTAEEYFRGDGHFERAKRWLEERAELLTPGWREQS